MTQPARREADLLKELARFGDGVVKLLAPVVAKPDFPLRVVKLAQLMRQKQKQRLRPWEDLALWGRQLAPDDPDCARLSDWALRKRVPLWHFPMLHDADRNAAYQKALEKFVKPGMVVLEIGSGSGILAMMAARAGAGHVYTCDQEPLMVEVARENIRRNGYAGQITVISKMSSQLQIGADLPRKADLLVSELVDDYLLGDDVLSIIEDAQRRLLHPQAIIVPAVIGAMGMLVGGPSWVRRFRVETVCGFDLSALNRLSPPEVSIPADQILSETFSQPFPLFSFDFSQADHFPAASRRVEVLATREGRIDGALQWLRLDFDSAIFFENRPPTQSHWWPRLHVFPKPLTVRPGDMIKLRLEHDRNHISLSPCDDQE